MNTDERTHRFTLSVEGSGHLGHVELLTDTREAFIEVPGLSSRLLAVRVQAVPHDTEGWQPIVFELVTEEHGGRRYKLHEKARFYVPRGFAPPGGGKP